MPKDVLITPLSAKVEFKDTNSTLDGLIQLDASDNLSITSPNGSLNLGNAASNISIGDGTATVDMIFQQSGTLSATTGSILTLGSSASTLTFGGPVSLNQELIIGTATNSRIRFTNNTSNIYLRTLTTGAASFEGTSGQLFSITDSMSGTIFSVNDISGIPSIEVLDTGLIKLNQYNGQTVIGGSAAAGTAELTVYPSAAANLGLVVKGFTSQSGDLQQWQNSSGSVIGGVTAGGSMYIARGTALAANALGVSTGSTTNIGIIVRGEASQSADLQQWQDSAGTVLTRIANGGQLYSSAPLVLGTTYFTSTLSVQTRNSSEAGIIIRGSASQSVSLQEWQNSAGSVLSSIRSDGGLYITAASDNRLYNLGIGGSSNGISWLYVTPASASQKPVVIRGAASQSANLQEWQDSSANVILSVSSTADLVSAGNRSARFSYFQNVGGTGSYLDFATVSNSAAIIQRVTTAVGLIVRGAASQTGNLQEWQNSSATILSRIDNNGNLFATVASIGGTGISSGNLRVVASATTIVPITARGAASQTANLQEWQNSGGTVLARVNSSGQFVGDGSQLTGISAGANEIMVIMGAY